MGKFKVSITAILLFLLLMLTACADNDSNPIADGGSNPIPFSDATTAAFEIAVDDSFATVTNKSGISVAVYKDGYSMWIYATGDADSETEMTEDTPAYAYSITKTFTSALILTQVENGLYSLSDTVSDLLGDHDDYENFDTDQINVTATVEQLLKHTSGMPDYATNVTAMVGMCDPDRTWTPADILTEIVYEDYCNVGDYDYSNTNYTLLGMIAEYMGGEDLNILFADEFFTPLDIYATLSPQDSVPSEIAHPYDESIIFGVGDFGFMDLTLGLYALYPTYNIYTGIGRSTWAAGGIISTADQLAKWGFELYDDDGDAVTASVRTAIKDSVAVDGDYGYGVGYYEFTYNDGSDGRKYGHGGSAAGYYNLLRYEENQGITVAIITNANNSFDGSGLIDREALAEDLFNAYKDNN